MDVGAFGLWFRTAIRALAAWRENSCSLPPSRHMGTDETQYVVRPQGHQIHIEEQIVVRFLAKVRHLLLIDKFTIPGFDAE